MWVKSKLPHPILPSRVKRGNDCLESWRQEKKTNIFIHFWVPCYVMDFKIFQPWNSLALERILLEMFFNIWNIYMFFYLCVALYEIYDYHFLQWLSPVWLLLWETKLSVTEKNLPHRLHWYGFSPVWILKWQLRWPLSEKALLYFLS